MRALVELRADARIDITVASAQDNAALDRRIDVLNKNTVATQIRFGLIGNYGSQVVIKFNNRRHINNVEVKLALDEILVQRNNAAEQCCVTARSHNSKKLFDHWVVATKTLLASAWRSSAV